MHDDQRAAHTNDAQPTLPAGDGAGGASAWRRIAQIGVRDGGEDSHDADSSLGDAIAASLPAGLTSAATRGAIQQAVLAALARRARQTGHLPHAVVVSQHANAAGAHSGRGWSFFVVERPAHASQDAGEAVELFLYCDG